MREISLHILDIVQNSIEAGATKVDLRLDEDTVADKMTIVVRDNGRGMDEDLVHSVTDPFVTTRTTRQVGLGIPLMKATAELCSGSLTIQSTRGRGTVVTATFQRSHIDRPPLGDMKGTLLSIIIGNSQADLHYVHVVDGQKFELDTADIKRVLDGVPLSAPNVIRWLSEYLDQDFKEVA